MVEMKEINGEKISVCQECGLGYRESQWAEKCENWCEEHHSCSIEITKHAIDVK
ncbi:MAG: hypothetical protein J4431_03830 [Candidatus Aenigmarchaeota archaeon]|nr:hypothetical protein [Candidatus Aenigmarchaeota archaeon]